MTTVAFIGVGRMGSRMALRLLDAGHVVHVFDPNTAATAELAVKGAVVEASPSAAAAPAMFVLSSLPSPATLRDAITGENGILKKVAAGATVIDFSTVDASTTKAIAAQCEAKGVHFMDAPVSGGVAGASAGTLLVMAGGSQDVLDAARPVLGPIAGRIVHCGPVGSGQLTKLAHNLLTAINTVALGEVLSASVKSGANLSVLTEVLSGGLAGSKMLDYLPKTLFTEERPANFALDLMHKDISLCLEEFSAYPMPLGQMVRQIYNMARAEGLGGKDSTSVAEVFENLLKVELRLPASA
ncbi:MULTISPECIES: NAD(P)-dependent oxidoreductase [Sinorhizobium/Ensifer group]|nr:MULTISPECIES: NAD(P)-dependent oxidoreductase [Sinorhizobium]MCK3781196.1 NAD(P)-dependent oxidoreductase [Ensifer sesbaniae]MQW99335.1 NAD-binding protein [Sinorhizobium fredii]MQX11589.1 NAD-binding protein [Sinorhizobium fredii]OAP45258.1 hydroxyacid oxidoreductase [Sinorhizobium glycinis]UTY47566.1 NAD(P)-dependent oxidoreductase [Sinorhizobium fredii]